MRVFVKPAEGLKVREEFTKRHIAVEGEEVELTRFIQRRISAGDLLVIEAPSEPTKKASKKSTPESEG